jgi:valine dehydrogenase (NAD+)
MDVVARECSFVTGRTLANGGAGDSSVLTALGVYQGMRASAEHAWGSTSLRGRHVGVAGVGKVGRHLVGHLVAEGARVSVTDVDADAVEAVLAQYTDARPGVEPVESAAEMVGLADLDLYAPCALGKALDDDVAERLQAQVVCGAANNQLAHDGIAKQLEQRGIVYAPDYCVNSGGLMQVADELHGFVFERAKVRAEGIYDTTLMVLRTAADEGVPPSTAADRLAERRIAEMGRLSQLWLPPR